MEWSGVLLYTITNGDIDNPNELEILCEDFFFMNKGTAGYTDFEMNEKDTVALMNYDERLIDAEVRTGLIHSHHTMAPNPSGTDNEELQENVEAYNSYLSLIVATGYRASARLAFKTTIETEQKKVISFKNILHKLQHHNTTETTKTEVCAYYKCDVTIGIDVPTNFIERVDLVEKRQEEEKQKTTVVKGFVGNGYNDYHRHPYNDKYNYGGYGHYQNNHKENQNPSPKHTISDMTAFIGKMIHQNPKYDNQNLHYAFKPFRYQYNKSLDGLIDGIDDCMEATFGEKEYKKMKVSDKLDFIDSVLLFLDNGSQSFIKNYFGAEVLADALDQTIQVSKEVEDGSVTF